MERGASAHQQKGPRANRSKKNLPAAFFSTEPRLVASTAAVREHIRLDSLVFLSSCPQRHGHFTSKKMLHAASLGLFCYIELPSSEHQRDAVRSSLQEWLGRWSALHAEHPELFVEVCETYWDAPVGYPMGILTEYMPLGSLDELTQACGGLPEEAMREVAQCVLEALDALHTASPPLVHGFVKPSQVLFGADGRPKLTFGLEQRLKGCQVWSLAGPGGPPANGSGSAARSTSLEQSPVVDIFDLGLLLLVSALGGQDVLLDAIPYAREFGSHKSARGPSAPLNAVFLDTCALLQHELGGAFRGDADGGGSDAGYLPPASDLLFNRRYSGPFLAFVSLCLEAHTHSTPVTAHDLLQHEFLHEQVKVGPLVSLHEMQGLAWLLNEAPSEQDPSRFGPAKSARSLVPGVAPSVAQSAQHYLINIAQSIASSWGSPGGRLGGPLLLPPSEGEACTAGCQSQTGWRRQEWDALVMDTARTLGLQRSVVQDALQAQLERLSGGARPVREPRRRAGSDL